MVQTKIIPGYPALVIEGYEKNLVITDLHVGFEGNLSQNNIRGMNKNPNLDQTNTLYPFPQLSKPSYYLVQRDAV